MTNPDFIKLSESMGAKAIKCSNLEELPAKMKEFLEYDNTRPILMECLVSSEHVYPMVAAGKALHEQIVSPPMACLPNRADISFTHLCEKRPSRSVISCSLVLRCIYDICLRLFAIVHLISSAICSLYESSTALSTNSLEMHSIASLRITESGQRRLAGFHQFLSPKIPLSNIQLSNIITRHSYH